MIEHVLALPEGYRLQEYSIRRTLGFGGFGITYEALDTNLDKTVAIKEYLPSDLAVRLDGSTVSARSDQDLEGFQWGRERFLDEARTVARFDHPNIIRIHRFFEQNGTGYIVMEYVDGQPLSKLLAETGPLDESRIRGWLWPVLEGLKVIHQANFLHRDIKPQNIMIGHDGNPVLLDFGAARVAIGGHTRSLTSILTPGFAPLEQYQSRGNQGPWTDIYAMGAVIYCCMTGKKPLDALDRVTDDKLVRPDSNATRSYSAGLVNGVMAALSVRDSERPQSIDQWMAILNEHASGATRIVRPEQADTIIRSESAPATQAPRNAAGTNSTSGLGRPKMWAVVGLPVLLGLVLIGFWILQNLPGPPGVGPAQDSGEEQRDTVRTQDIAMPNDRAAVPDEGTIPGQNPRQNTAMDKPVFGQADLEDSAPEKPASELPASQALSRMFALTINAEPPDAAIRLLNIDATYRPGITLEPGRYEVEISRSGYRTVKRTLEIYDQPRTIPIKLRPTGEIAARPAAEPTQPLENAPSLVIVTGCDDKKPIKSVTPQYPQAAAARGVEGQVTLDFTVEADGRVVDPRVRSADPAGLFENAALEAIRQFRFRPNTFGGQDHPCLGTQDLRFSPR